MKRSLNKEEEGSFIDIPSEIISLILETDIKNSGPLARTCKTLLRRM